MQRNRLFTFMCAAVLGVVGIVAVLAYVNGADTRAVRNKEPVWVLAVKQPIPAGTTGSTAISNRLLQPSRYPRGSLPADYVVHLTGKERREVLTSALEPGAILRKAMFGPRSATSSHLVVPGNDMAIGLAVCGTQAVGGFIGPGSTVAVYNIAGKTAPLEASCQSHQPPAGGTVASVVLPSVEVLAVQSASAQTTGTQLTGGAGGSGACAAAGEGQLCVIVAVTTAESLRLADIAATGDLELLLLTKYTQLPSKTGTYSSP